MERPAWLPKLNSTPVMTCYHLFILIVSFCVLSSLIIKDKNIIYISNYRCIVYCIFQRYGQPYQITDVLYTVFSKDMGNLIKLQMYCILYFPKIWATLSNYICTVYCIFQIYG